MGKNRCAEACCRLARCKGMHAVTFGLGLAVATFCPIELVLFLTSVIIVALGFTLFRCG